ncbi:ABC transporter permease [Synoicihabitans lomoniglobus]|uniref:ABC transporter permease n=1 Tax=Synoicihabitans lomoniglobus TaxID=2909285 RepID=A0AAF0I450_9BACT|nr:ABC transporter permease [Opitutaceae bacterium LMO-M01]WED66554.1 ABC transporter permease [Opitutaceae bacterium LMO-M01]
MLSLIRQSVRRLVRERGFTATVLLTLALCIGANVAIFAVVDAVLLRPLPFPEPDRLVTLRNSYPGAGAPLSGASLPNYFDRRNGAIPGFESVAIVQNSSAIIGETGSPQRVARDRVSPEFLETLGVPLARGRTFTDDELVYANAQVMIITHEFWQTQFNGVNDVLGRTLLVDGQTVEVVGVLPPGFRYLDSEARFLTPYASGEDERTPQSRHSNNHRMVVRLAPGISVESAQKRMDAFNQALLETDPNKELVIDAGFRTIVTSLRADAVRDVRDMLVLLQAGVLALLVIGGVNLVNLLLIRAHGRTKEFAVRQALGAGTGQLSRDVLIETILLALAGGTLGVLGGIFAIDLLSALGTDQLPLGVTIAFDSRVGLVALVGSLMVGVLLAVPVLLLSLKLNLARAISTESRGGTVSRAAQRVRHAFIVVQVALAFTLLCGAGLLGVSLQRVLHNPPGFQPDAVLTARLQLPWESYPNAEKRQAFLERVESEIRAQPGVTHVGFTDGLPFGGDVSDNATVVEGVEPAPGESIRTHFSSFAMGDYWAALGIPVLRGRVLTASDQIEGNRVCVVDQAFVDRYWPDGADPIGRRLALGVHLDDENALRIVGVVGTIKQRDLTDTAPLGSVYLPYPERPRQRIAVAINTVLPAAQFAPSLRRVVAGIDPSLPVDDIRVLNERIEDSLLIRRSPAMLAGIFAGVALLLAAIGTYGVLAYAVGQRRREIGVRMALGALPGQVLRQFLALGSKLLLCGLALGVAGAWATGRAIQSVLFQTEAFHWGVALGTAAVLATVVLLATLLPSQRASRVSPLEALRED